MKNNIIVYWVESTNLMYDDEIIKLTICDNDGKILFNQVFTPRFIESYLCNGKFQKLPSCYLNAKPFEHFRHKVQSIFDQADTLIGFSNHAIDDLVLKHEGIILPKVSSYDVMEMFAVIDDPSIEHCASYFGYEWQHDKNHRSSVDYVKAVNFCWQQMMHNSKVQNDN